MILDAKELLVFKQMLETLNFCDDAGLGEIVAATCAAYAPHRKDLVVEWGDKGLTVRPRETEQAELPGVKE